MHTGSVGTSSPIGLRRLLPFSLRTPQRNRNELGETTVNKTWRDHTAAARKINNLEDIHCVRDAGTVHFRRQRRANVGRPARCRERMLSAPTAPLTCTQGPAADRRGPG